MSFDDDMHIDADDPMPRFGRGSCWTPSAELSAWFFPERRDGEDNHGAKAKAICAGCPIRRECLVGALARNEEHGIWGGAGEQRRRTLRRAQAGGDLEATLAAHWRNLDGRPEAGDDELLAAFGPGATHGNPATYAKGCRCEPCCLAVAGRTAATKLKTRRRRPAAS